MTLEIDKCHITYEDAGVFVYIGPEGIEVDYPDAAVILFKDTPVIQMIDKKNLR